MSAQLPWPISRVAGATACLHIPWVSTAALPCLDLRGQCRADCCPCTRHLQTRLFRKPGKQFVLEGCTLLQGHLAKPSYIMHILLLLQQSPSFSWDFKMPQVCTDYLCRFSGGTPCSKAPCAPPSSHCGLPLSQPGQGQVPGCHQTVPQGVGVPVRELWFSTAMWPCCGCSAQTPLPQQGHPTRVLWAATAEAAASALLGITREKRALSGAMHLTPVRCLLLHRVNYILRALIDYRSSPG